MRDKSVQVEDGIFDTPVRVKRETVYPLKAEKNAPVEATHFNLISGAVRYYKRSQGHWFQWRAGDWFCVRNIRAAGEVYLAIGVRK